MTDLLHQGELFSIADLHRMGLKALLVKSGVQDPVTFLAENVVDHVAIFKPDVGMSIVITGVKPKVLSKKPSLQLDEGS